MKLIDFYSTQMITKNGDFNNYLFNKKITISPSCSTCKWDVVDVDVVVDAISIMLNIVCSIV